MALMVEDKRALLVDSARANALYKAIAEVFTGFHHQLRQTLALDRTPDQRPWDVSTPALKPQCENMDYDGDPAYCHQPRATGAG
jgi:hypothetical protein